jgi:hypothetical protein
MAKPMKPMTPKPGKVAPKEPVKKEKLAPVKK